MNFLHPLLLLGALGVAAPVWLHLRRKPDEDVLYFSALRFLEDEPVPRDSPQRLRDVLMFLLRALAVLLIAGAFAWPYRKGPAAPEVSDSRVYILDNTLSNQAGDNFTHGRDEILAALRQAGDRTQVAVVELRFQPHTVVNFGDSRAQAEIALRALKPSFGRGSFLAAFNQANALLSQSLGVKKEIVIYSDNQENQWSEGLNTPPFLNNIEVKLAQVPALKERPNLAVQEPMAARFFVGDKAIVNASILLRHFGEAQTAVVTLTVNHQQILRRDVDLAANPGDIRLLAQWQSDPTLWLAGEAMVEGTPDDLPGDNSAWFALPPMNEGRVAILTQSVYLRTALMPEVMRGHWSARVLQPSKLADELNAPLSDDVLMVEAGYLQSRDARDLVFRFLNNGHGVVLLLNRMTPLVRGVLSSLGFEVVRDAQQDDPSAAAAQSIRYVALQHPIFAPFTQSDFGDLSAVKILQHVQIVSKTAQPLVFSENGDGLLFEALATKGRLLVSTFGFDRDQTDWPVQMSFVPFLDSLLHYARGLKEMQTSFEPGETYVMEIPPGDAAPHEVVLRKDDAPVLRAAVDANRKAQIAVPDEPGVYAITYDADPAVRSMIAVNPSAKESELTYTDAPAAIKAWQVPERGALRKQMAPPAVGVDFILPAQALHQRLWWLLLSAASLALVLEMVWLFVGRART